MPDQPSILSTFITVLSILSGLITPVVTAYILLKKFPSETKALDADAQESEVAAANNAVETLQKFAHLYEETFAKLLERDTKLAELNATVGGLQASYTALEAKFTVTDNQLNAERTLRRQAELERDNLNLEVAKLKRRVADLERITKDKENL